MSASRTCRRPVGWHRASFRRATNPLQRWRRFNGHELVADVLAGATFNDGIRVTDDINHDQTTDEKVAA